MVKSCKIHHVSHHFGVKSVKIMKNPSNSQPFFMKIWKNMEKTLRFRRVSSPGTHHHHPIRGRFTAPMVQQYQEHQRFGTQTTGVLSGCLEGRNDGKIWLLVKTLAPSEPQNSW